MFYSLLLEIHMLLYALTTEYGDGFEECVFFEQIISRNDSLKFRRILFWTNENATDENHILCISRLDYLIKSNYLQYAPYNLIFKLMTNLLVFRSFPVSVDETCYCESRAEL